MREDKRTGWQCLWEGKRKKIYSKTNEIPYECELGRKESKGNEIKTKTKQNRYR